MQQAQQTRPKNIIKASEKNKPDLYKVLGSKVPPHSLNAEMAVIGGLLLSRGAFSRVVNIIDEDSFYDRRHREIFLSIKSIFDKNQNIDLLTLSEELRRRGTLAEIGGDQYIAELNRRSPSAANVESHALIVLEKQLKRLLIEKSGEIMSNAFEDTIDVLEEIDRAENTIFQIAQKRFSKSYQSMKDISKKTMDLIMELSKRSEGGVTGVSTGFKKMDEMLGGFQNSDLIIVAARPSMGKTALGLSVLLNVAVYHQQPVAFFSIEMASTQIAIRLVSAQARVDQSRIRSGKLSQHENSQIVKGLGKLADSPIFIDDSAMMNVLELKAKCRRLKAEHDIKLVIVDYLQLLQAPKAESREREISIISQTLKQIAKDLEIPVIALAQLNRSVENRKDFRPMLQDLRESGSIEQDADVVMFVNRPERYNKETLWDGTDSDGMAEIIIGKQRNGPTGNIKLVFQKDFARFENYAMAPEEQPQSVRDQYFEDMKDVPTPEEEPEDIQF
jgi:replicative DNA helicase